MTHFNVSKRKMQSESALSQTKATERRHKKNVGGKVGSEQLTTAWMRNRFYSVLCRIYIVVKCIPLNQSGHRTESEIDDKTKIIKIKSANEFNWMSWYTKWTKWIAKVFDTFFSLNTAFLLRLFLFSTFFIVFFLTLLWHSFLDDIPRKRDTMHW